MKLIVLIMGLLALPPLAVAKENAAAKEHYLKGTRAFELGAYDEAIEEYAAAYRLKDDPALLYNLGQAHRLAGHGPEALRFYKLFLAKVPETPARPEVEQKMAELQKLIEQQQRARNVPPDTVKPPEGTTATTPESGTPPPESHETVATAPSGAAPFATGRSRVIAGAVVGGAGVAMVAVGIAFGVLAKHASDNLSALDRNMQMFDFSQQQSGKTDQIVEGVFLGLGSAAVVAGAVLVVLGHRETRRTSVALRLQGAEIRF